MTPVIVSTVTVQNPEGLNLDGLNLNDGNGTHVTEQLVINPPGKRYEWAQGADMDGSLLIRDPLSENREVTLRIRMVQQLSMDAALAPIKALSDKLEECERNPDGLPMTWTPASGTKSMTLYVLSGSIDELPVDTQESGWFIFTPVVTVKLICKPFGYGADQTITGTTGTTPLLTFLAAGVQGDAPAEGRLIVTDGASQSRRYIEWGLEQRYYDAAQSLQLNSFVTSGYAGSSTTRSGSFNTNVIRTTLAPQAVAVCGLGNLGHVGTFRVKLRCWPSSLNERVRLAWTDGDGPLRGNPWVTPVTEGAFNEFDLGVITITPKTLGTQRWTGRIEAYSTTATGDATFGASNTSNDTLDVDYLQFIPAGEGYGKARAQYSYTPGIVTAHDEFEGITPGTALSGRTAPAGGTWTTAGSTTDFAAATVSWSQSAEARSTASDSAPRFAVIGSAVTDTEAGLKIFIGAPGLSSGLVGAVARYVDTSNYLRASIPGSFSPGANVGSLVVSKVIAGTATPLAFGSYPTAKENGYQIRLVVYASGRGIAFLMDFNGAILDTLRFSDTTLATAGTLASGKAGFVDYNPTADTPTRYYDDAYAGTSIAENIALYSGRQVEIRHDGALRQDSTGTYWGHLPHRGSRMLVPPAGDKNRTSRVAVKAHRNDLEAEAHSPLGDSLTASLIVTPRFIVIPA